MRGRQVSGKKCFYEIHLEFPSDIVPSRHLQRHAPAGREVARAEFEELVVGLDARRPLGIEARKCSIASMLTMQS
jgi:hypothetical protein